MMENKLAVAHRPMNHCYLAKSDFKTASLLLDEGGKKNDKSLWQE